MSHWARRRCSRISHGEWGKPFGRVPRRAGGKSFTAASIAVVLAGTFQYRSSLGRELLSPGSLMLGNEGQRYECSHDHGTGDRCVLFRYTRAYLDRLGVEGRFGALRVPPLRPLAPL